MYFCRFDIAYSFEVSERLIFVYGAPQQTSNSPPDNSTEWSVPLSISRYTSRVRLPSSSAAASGVTSRAPHSAQTAKNEDRRFPTIKNLSVRTVICVFLLVFKALLRS